jgi:hypothetical protein
MAGVSPRVVQTLRRQLPLAVAAGTRTAASRIAMFIEAMAADLVGPKYDPRVEPQVEPQSSRPQSRHLQTDRRNACLLARAVGDDVFLGMETHKEMPQRLVAVSYVNTA